MPEPPPKDTPHFGPDLLTVEEVMPRRIGISFHSTQEAQFKQWVQQLKAKEKPPSTGSGQAPLIGEMFVYNLNARAKRDAW